jgi:hypothetical protein
MFYVGLDIHDKRIAICVLSEAGQVSRRVQVRTIDEMMRIRRDDPQRKKIALVATAHYLVRVMWALLKDGTTWEEDVATADEPKRVAQTTAVI